jgi:hypothetical protein
MAQTVASLLKRLLQGKARAKGRWFEGKGGSKESK